MKTKLQKAFTLVELLIVIALIAILSVAVLSTINPIEQANKAKDSTMMNDAGEVLNATERYYASNMASAQYQWSNLADKLSITNDTALLYDSQQAGFGLCNVAAASSFTACMYDPATATTRGVLIDATELKDSFLQKNYAGNLSKSATPPTEVERLYLVKRDATEGNSIFVCFVPKASANRKNTSGLKKIVLGAAWATTPTDYTFDDVDTTPVTGDFEANGNPKNPPYTFADVSTSLFKCVP